MDLKDMVGLAGKVTVVLGGGQGIGEQMCLKLAAAGSDVAVVDLDPAKAEAMAARLVAIGVRAEALSGDMRDAAETTRVFDAVADTLGVPDRMVTIIGQATFKPAVDVTQADWDADFALNTRHYFLAAQAFARQLIAAGKSGAIASIASVDGIMGSPVHAIYGAAKAAMIHLVKSLGVEWADHGIRVNAVAAGAIVTPRMPDTDERRAIMHDSLVPMRRSGETSEIANALLFLLSDLSSYMTGQTIAVDGGWTVANLFNVTRGPLAVRPSADGGMGQRF